MDLEDPVDLAHQVAQEVQVGRADLEDQAVQDLQTDPVVQAAQEDQVDLADPVVSDTRLLL